MTKNFELASKLGAKIHILCKDGSLEITMAEPQLDAFADTIRADQRHLNLGEACGKVFGYAVPVVEPTPTAEALKEMVEDYANEMACETTSTRNVWPDIEAAQKKLYDAIDALAGALASKDVLISGSRQDANHEYEDLRNERDSYRGKVAISVKELAAVTAERDEALAKLAGTKSDPQVGQKPEDPDATHFRLGDVWCSPLGTRYKVIQCTEQTAILWNGGIYPTLYIGLQEVVNHGSGNHWVRESWGGQP